MDVLDEPERCDPDDIIVREPELTCIYIKGGLPPPLLDQATAGELRWRRRPEELRETFELRAKGEAVARGCKIIVFDGLPIPGGLPHLKETK